MADFVRAAGAARYSVLLSRFVKRLFGHGNWHTAGSVKSHPGRTSTPAIRFAEAPAGMSSSSVRAADAAANPLFMTAILHPGPGLGSLAMDLAAADHAYLWHPFTQMRDWVDEEPLIVERGEGSDLIDAEGRRYLDGVSSLWCNVHGHRTAAHRRGDGRPARTHRPQHAARHQRPAGDRAGARLVAHRARRSDACLLRRERCERGRDRAQDGLPVLAATREDRRTVRGAAKPTTATRSARSASAASTSSTRSPAAAVRPPKAEPGDAADMDAAARGARGEVAAVIVEPLVQGAAGMLAHPPGYLRAVRELCDPHDVLLIADEVATGFGRTGRMFACEHEGVAPDLVVGKGITGGYLPLSAMLTTRAVYDAFLGDSRREALLPRPHVHGQPARVRGRARQPRPVRARSSTLERLGPKSRGSAGRSRRRPPRPHVGDVRQRGFMVGIELVAERVARWPARIGPQRHRAARRRGVILRPLGNVLVLMPPLGIADQRARAAWWRSRPRRSTRPRAQPAALREAA